MPVVGRGGRSKGRSFFAVVLVTVASVAAGERRGNERTREKEERGGWCAAATLVAQ